MEMLFLSGLASTALGIVGAYWDAGWHQDFGILTFWTPPHILILGSVAVTFLVLSLNLAIAIKRKTAHREHAFFVLLLFFAAAVILTYFSWPAEFLRDQSAQNKFFTFPHIILLIAGVTQALFLSGIARYHILHERHKYLIEELLVPIFLGGALANLVFLSEKGIKPGFSISFALVVFLLAKRFSSIRWGATASFFAYVLLTLMAVIFSTYISLRPPVYLPVVPSVLWSFFIIAVLIDFAHGKIFNFELDSPK